VLEERDRLAAERSSVELAWVRSRGAQSHAEVPTRPSG
jgi:hypothetical protein